MPKYLRHLAVGTTPEVQAALGENIRHLPWMLERYLDGYETGGVGKVNIGFTADPAEASATPTEVLAIATVDKFFDAAAYTALSPVEQQDYYLDRMIAALERCARQFGWPIEPLAAARQRMIDDNLRLAFFWKKPLTSPDRQHKAQGLIEAGTVTELSLVFTNRSGAEIRRSLISRLSVGSFDPNFVFKTIAWQDNETVRVTQDNGRDYWLCHLAGAVEFHYPRAENGDAAGQCALGRMYYEGWPVLQDRERGLQLIKAAAAQGDKHAIALLKRIVLQADAV